MFTQQLPPPSSGSESSGYFTPPAEHHLVQEQLSDNFTSNEAFEEKNDFSVINNNFQIVDSEASECHETEEVMVIYVIKTFTLGNYDSIYSVSHRLVQLKLQKD